MTMLLELVAERPDWTNALNVALTRPAGVPERREGQDPWKPTPSGRPRRISDDLAWLRRALDEPERHGLQPLPDTAAVAAWEAGDGDSALAGRLARLSERGVLEAAGFLVHEPLDNLL